MKSVLVIALAFISRAAMAEGVDLFELTRSLNRNKVIYKVSVKEGKFTGENPIAARWEMVEKGGKAEPLTALEKRKAYGVSIESVKAEEIVFSLKAYPTRKLKVRWVDEAGVKTPKAIVKLAGADCALTRVHLVLGKKAIIPSVKSIELYGVDLTTGENKSLSEIPTH